MKNLIKISTLAIYLVAMLPALALADTVGSAGGATPAKMYFDPSSGSVVANPNFTVDIKVDIGTGAQSASVDAIVTFDPTKLTYVSASKVTTGNPGTFYGENGLFTSTPAATVNSTGTVEIGRTADPGTFASGVGTVARLTFTPKVAVGQTVDLDFGFTAGASTDSNVSSNVGDVDLLGEVTNATLTIANAPAAGPTITGISPTHNGKDVAQTVVISGTNFGDTQGSVYLGTDLVTVTSWSATSITVNLPAKSNLTTSTTYPIKVVRSDAQEITYTGYTYDVTTTGGGGTLPENGPEVFTYFGLAMSAFGMAGVTYLKLFERKRVQVVDEQPIQLS